MYRRDIAAIALDYHWYAHRKWSLPDAAAVRGTWCGTESIVCTSSIGLLILIDIRCVWDIYKYIQIHIYTQFANIQYLRFCSSCLVSCTCSSTVPGTGSGGQNMYRYVYQ